MSLLTDYRPNFCADCGERILRLRWRAWTSRVFCDKCFPRFGRAQRLRRTCLTVGLLLFGFAVGRSCRPKPPPLLLQRAGVSTQPGETNPAPPVQIEQSYICGARTKKGTPCSRRVHGPIRCWQHKGAKAMLPLEKLVIKE